MGSVAARFRLGLWIFVIGLVAFTAAITYWVTNEDTPSDDSAASGFLRDMITHHAQAVEMGLTMFERSEDPAIRTLALDILTTQQAQIGMMQGWLQAWGLSQTGAEPPMAWMGHAMDGRMPGIASDEEIERLRDLPPDEAEILFLRLMIAHHAAGVDMAEAVLDRSDEPLVTGLAEKVVASQQAEIDLTGDMLTERGVEAGA